jgi:hypothetical protein
MYGCSLIDRTNLPNARLAGMDLALGTNIGDRYSIITLLCACSFSLYNELRLIARQSSFPVRRRTDPLRARH